MIWVTFLFPRSSTPGLQAAAISWEAVGRDRAAGPVLGAATEPSRSPNTQIQMPTAFAHHSQREGGLCHSSWPKDQLFRLCAKTQSALGYSSSSLPEAGSSELLTEVCSVRTHQG